MKERIAVVFLVTALLLCVVGEDYRSGPQEETYQLYYLNENGDYHGPALAGEAWQPEDPEAPVEPGDLLRALLLGPKEEGLVSPFPKGVYLGRVDHRDGTVTVRLSEAYGGLSDIALTLADYSIVLTRSQLEGVEAVEIQTSGYPADYRSHQTLKAEEVMMADLLAIEDSFS